MARTKCPVCGKGPLRSEIGDFKASFEDSSGVVQEVLVRDISKRVCDACGEFILDQEAEERISSAQRAAMGLLSAEELIRFRKSLFKTQEEMAELLCLGKKTWCRWESNDHFQSESLDCYLRLLIENPANVLLLERMKHDRSIGEEKKASAVAARFWQLECTNALRERANTFTELFTSGQLQVVEELVIQ
jgi:putative zinc finger/helix-turn-helix YgiT family protein